MGKPFLPISLYLKVTERVRGERALQSTAVVGPVLSRSLELHLGLPRGGHLERTGAGGQVAGS